MAEAPAVVPFEQNEVITALKLKQQINDLNSHLEQRDRALAFGVDEATKYTPGVALPPLEYILGGDMLDWEQDPNHQEYVCQSPGTYYVTATVTPCTPVNAHPEKFTVSTIYLTIQVKQGEGDWRPVVHSGEQQAFIWGDYKVPRSVSVDTSMYFQPGDRVRLSMYIGGNGLPDDWSGSYNVNTAQLDPTMSNRIDIVRIASDDFGGTPTPLPALLPWEDGEQVMPDKMNQNITAMHAALLSRPRINISGTVKGADAKKYDVKWNTANVKKTGAWAFDGTTLTVPEDGTYYLSAHVTLSAAAASGATQTNPAWAQTDCLLNGSTTSIAQVPSRFYRSTTAANVAYTTMHTARLRDFKAGDKLKFQANSGVLNHARESDADDFSNWTMFKVANTLMDGGSR